MNMMDRLRLFYYLRFKRMTSSEYNQMVFRKEGGKIGERCYIFSDIRTLETSLITIGDNVTVSGDVCFCTHDNAISKVLPGTSDLFGRITIGNNCFIGMRSLIMFGVTLGDNCIVGAGSVVTSSFPANSVIAGNPARYICSSQEYGEKNREYALNVNSIPFSERSQYFAENNKIKLVVKKEKSGNSQSDI